MFNELKKIMSKELKEKIAEINLPIWNLNKEMETLKRKRKF